MEHNNDGGKQAASLVPHMRLTYGEEEVEAASEVIRSGQWSCGPKVEELEKALARKANVAHGACVGSGLSALTLALRGLGVAKGDEVIIPAYSFVALVNAVLACDAKPVLVDARDSDWNIDPALVGEAVTDSTKAIMVVDTFGAPVAVRRIRDLGIPLIEDCAHGFGIEVDGGVMGSRGTASILSFHSTKPMGAGEGGVILSDSEEITAYARKTRDYDHLSASPTRHNDQMTDIEASIALVQLQRYDAMMEQRAQHARRYHKLLVSAQENTGAFVLPKPSERRIWYRYAVEVKNTTGQEMVGALRKRGVGSVVPVVDWRTDASSQYPVADYAYKQLVSLPLYPTLQEGEQDRVCEAFLQAVSA